MPRDGGRQHWAQYGALGMMGGALLGFFFWWGRVQVNRDERTSQEKTQVIKMLSEGTHIQAQAYMEMSGTMRALAEASKKNAEATEQLNKELRRLRITGRRQ